MAIKNEVYDAFSVAKNQAVSNIELTFDPSQWSVRMKNILVKAIDTGVADCGYETARWVNNFLEKFGLGTQEMHYWRAEMDVKMIKPERVEEAKAYVAALIRLRGDGMTSWTEDIFLRYLADGEEITRIPLPRTFSRADRQKFVDDFLKDQDETEQLLRAEIINMIRSNTPITISYNM